MVFDAGVSTGPNIMPKRSATPKPNSQSENWVPVLEKAIYTPRKIRIVIVGAGYSGLMLAHKIQHELKLEDFIDHKIYEKNDEVGGTWFENRYPGAACDVPGHIYTFSFEPNPNWSSFYVGAPEIWEYIKKTSDKYQLAKNAAFNSKVISAIWNESASKWILKIDQQGKIIDDEADILADASGILNKWRWPDIKGLRDFKGHLVHSARWVHDFDYTGKRVGIIGNGSSAIQILPEIQKIAAHVTNFIRSPTWISTNYGAHLTKDGKNFQYTEEEKEKFRNDPQALYEYRRRIEHEFNKLFCSLISDSPEYAAVEDAFTKVMKERLGGDEELAAKFIPKWKVGCRRLTPGDGYLEALQAPNCTPTFSPIKEITPKGILTEDGEIELDALICATGFDVSFCPQWKLIGKNGATLSETWKENPEAYLGIHPPGMPNYFIFNGPNCPIGHGSLLPVMEWTADYVCRWAKKIATEDVKSIIVKDKVIDDYNVYAQEFLKRTVWSSSCRSWYKNGKTEGKVTAMYPGSVLHYRELLENIRGEDFDFEYASPNKFRFMGNGFTLREERKEDLAFYVHK